MTRKKKTPARASAARGVKKKAAAAPPKTPVWKITPDQQIVGALFLGKIDDYFAQIGVIALTLEAPLAVGDTIRIKGHTTDLTQKVDHMELERRGVASASAGDAVGIKVADRARPGDAVYKL
jgi:hypothetical protein